MSRGKRKGLLGTTVHIHKTMLSSVPTVLSVSFSKYVLIGIVLQEVYLRALRDMFVIDVQEAKSRCLSLEQNLLRLVQVLQTEKNNEYTLKIKQPGY